MGQAMTERNPAVVIFKDDQEKIITIYVGNEKSTMTLGEWSKLLATPLKRG